MYFYRSARIIVIHRTSCSFGDPSKFTEQKIQIMQGSHTDLSKTSNKSTECTCVAIMLLVAFVLLITQYQTNQQLETEFGHPRLDGRNTSVYTRNKKVQTYDYCVFVLETRIGPWFRP